MEDSQSTDKPTEIKPNWLDSAYELSVSARSYREAMGALQLREDRFQPGSKMLSVGEGLSNFAKTVAEKFDCTAYALDPIYELEGKKMKGEDEPLKLFSSDPEKVDAVLKTAYGSKATFIRRGDSRDLVPLPDPKKVVPGSVYNLPFESEVFDFVCAVKLFEHMNVERALPELLRVVKNGGELRLAGCMLDVDVNHVILIGGWHQYDGNTGETYIEQATGINQALAWLGIQENINCFVICDDKRRSELRESGYRTAGVLVIRKESDNTPFDYLKNGNFSYKVRIQEPEIITEGEEHIEVATLPIGEV